MISRETSVLYLPVTQDANNVYSVKSVYPSPCMIPAYLGLYEGQDDVKTKAQRTSYSNMTIMNKEQASLNNEGPTTRLLRFIIQVQNIPKTATTVSATVLILILMVTSLRYHYCSVRFFLSTERFALFFQNELRKKCQAERQCSAVNQIVFTLR